MGTKLILIGYWHNRDSPNFPDPAWFVDETWDADERSKVISHLQTATYMPYACGGLSWCRFRCGEKAMGSREQTDGVYLWPEGLLHYIDKHNVKPPQQFIDHIMNYKPASHSIDTIDVDIDTDWWLQQTGNNHKQFTAKHPTDYGVLEISPETIKSLFKQKIRNVLWKLLYPAVGTNHAESIIANVLNGQTISIKGDFAPISDEVRNECMRLGVKVSFTMIE